jgi:DNA polymerase-3 subunit gamma/tau
MVSPCVPEGTLGAEKRVRVLLAAWVVAMAVPLTGCRTGSTWATPSWSMFGGKPPSAGSLSSAPAFPGDVTKPSANAKPYPVTSTPEGYALGDQAARSTGSASTPPANDPGGPVIYGSTPPPSASAASASLAGWQEGGASASPLAGPQRPEAAGVIDSPISSISPQVGPYGPSSQPVVQTPAPSSGLGRTPDSAAEPSRWGGPSAGPAEAGERMADARNGATWGAEGSSQMTASDPALPPPGGASIDDRYGTTTGSRFASPSSAAAPTADPGWSPIPSGAVTEPPPAAAAPGWTSPPPPSAQPSAQPVPPSAPPSRRADPGYRPFGTSSYRPPAEDSGAAGVVRQASFENGLPARP